jgi:hypothetical protein
MAAANNTEAYSPSCVEEEFSELRIHDFAKNFPEGSALASLRHR